jgi:LAO/AO transport system kinase
VLELKNAIKTGNVKAITRAISWVENHIVGYEALLESLQPQLHIPVIGFTGPPGAGKSSLVNSLAKHWLGQGLKIAILAVDPSSPFNFGSLLGDRIRMSELFTNPNIFIRSLSTRGSLGGLTASIIEITDVLRNSGFDRIIIETVGVGQSEVEIAGVADITIVVTVPESGDEIQTLKSGVMEIADIFVVNKADREGAGKFAHSLRNLAASRIPSALVIETVAVEGKGIPELSEAISNFRKGINQERKYQLLALKLERLIVQQKMKDFDSIKIAKELESLMNNPGFNLYLYSKKFV